MRGRSKLAIIFITAFVIGLVDSAAIAQTKDAAYSCVTEFAAGLAYNEAIKKWSSTTFYPTGKFTLRMKFLTSRIVRDTSGDDGESDYNVTITASGKNFAGICSTLGRDRNVVTVSEKYEAFRCNSFGTDYVFNLKTNRFLSIYSMGYVEGEDNNENTPSVSGGTCTKID